MRRHLGFSSTRPVIPSLLGSLFRETEPVANPESEAVGIAISTPLDLEVKLDDGARQAEPVNGAALSPTPVIANAEEGEEDFSLLDISDEELDLLIDKGSFPNGGPQPQVQLRDDSSDVEFTIPDSLFMDEQASETFKIEPAQSQTPSVPGFGEIEPSLEFQDYLPGLKSKPAEVPSALPDLDLSLDLPELDTGKGAAPAQFEGLSGLTRPQGGQSEDDFVIELSEDDLDSLLVELSHPPKGEAGAESKG
jgi:hypothetical protein